MSFYSRSHIKLVMVIEATSSYICSFSVYTRKGWSDVLKGHVTLDPDCSRTTKFVMGLLDKVQILDTGSHVYFVNYYSRTGLLDEMFHRQHMLVVLSEVIEKNLQKLS